MDYIQKVKIAGSLCDGVEDVEQNEYARGISEFIADTENLDIEEYGEELDVRSYGVSRDIERYIVK